MFEDYILEDYSRKVYTEDNLEIIYSVTYYLRNYYATI